MTETGMTETGMTETGMTETGMTETGMTETGMTLPALKAAMQGPEVVVAGHICVDVFPDMRDLSTALDNIMIPGKLTVVGPISVTTGGCVSNTGLALHRLGVQVQMMGKVGGDLFGDALLNLLNATDPALAAGMIHAPSEHASYTLVLEPPGVDRIFLHYAGPNATFGAADLPIEQVAQARIFHFGYPPILPRMYRDGGVELTQMLQAG